MNTPSSFGAEISDVDCCYSSMAEFNEARDRLIEAAIASGFTVHEWYDHNSMSTKFRFIREKPSVHVGIDLASGPDQTVFASPPEAQQARKSV